MGNGSALNVGCVRPDERRRRIAPLAALIGLMGLVVAWSAVAIVVTAPAAHAHASLVGSEPATGARIDRAPTQVVLRFDQPVTALPGALRVFSQGDRRVERGAARVSADGTVRVALEPGLGPGGYVAAWQVLSEDGHPIRGVVTFVVGDGDAAGLAGIARRLLADSDTPTDVRSVTIAGRMATTIGLAAALGSASWAVLGRRGRSETGPIRRLGVWGAIAAALGAALQFSALGPTMGAVSMGSAFDAALLDAATETRPGRLLLAAVVLAAALAVVVRARWTRPGSGAIAADATLVGVAVLAVAAFAGAGHGGSGPLPAVAWPMQAAHITAAGVWSGLLAVLLFGVVLPTHRGALGDRAAIARARRISTIIGGAVATVVASGAFATWRQVRSVQGMRETAYGTVLSVKIGLVAVMLALGWLNRRALGRPADPVALPRRLTRFGTVEIVASVLVLATSAVLAQRIPPREELGRPQVSTVEVAGLQVEVTLERRRPGPNELHLIVTDATGGRVEPQSITASAWLDADQVGPVEVTLRRAGPGHRVATPRFDLTGQWRIELEVSADEFTEDTGSVDVTIG